MVESSTGEISGHPFQRLHRVGIACLTQKLIITTGHITDASHKFKQRSRNAPHAPSVALTLFSFGMQLFLDFFSYDLEKYIYLGR